MQPAPRPAQDLAVENVLSKLVDQGHFQVLWKDLEWATGKARGHLVRWFPTTNLCMRCVARAAPGRIVDAIGLEPEARAALSDRDVKAIAWAVLAGRRLDRV